MIVSYDLAILARDLGFNIYCDKTYDEDSKELESHLLTIINDVIGFDEYNPLKAIEYLKDEVKCKPQNDNFGFFVFAPTHQKLRKWLEEKGVFVTVDSNKKGEYSYKCCNHGMDIWSNDIFDNYDKAMEQGLKEGLNKLNCK